MHLSSLRLTMKFSGRKVTHHFHQKGTFELACEVRICRRGPRKMVLVLSRVIYSCMFCGHLDFIVELHPRSATVLPHTPWPLQTRCFGSTCRPMDHIDSMTDSRCDSIGQHRTAPDMTGHQIGHFGHCSALHCPICTGHHRTLIGQSIGQSDTYRTPPPDSGPDIHRTFTGHSPDMTGHDRTVGHPGLRVFGSAMWR